MNPMNPSNLIDQIYEPVIGLEVHVQLATQSKIFCSCGTEFGKPANSQTCPVCLGFPGVLPVLNRRALEYAVKTAAALHADISEIIKFDRKNYFYPDLPKNFQISQFDMPLARGGYVEIDTDSGIKRIKIKRIHLEEDAGKLIHEQGQDTSLVDYNRSGIPLLEIVSEPDINSAQEAYSYLINLKAILEYLEVSDCDMEKGSLRCDANISLRPEGASEMGIKTELKNMNSFKAVRQGLEFEISRQRKLLNQNIKLRQETRLWDEQRQETITMRTKEEAYDYRYFPEPDLPVLVIPKENVDSIRRNLTELPRDKKRRFVAEYNLSDYDAGVLTQDKKIADYFERCLKNYEKPKTVANWIIHELLSILNEAKIEISACRVRPEGLAELLKLVDAGSISGKMAKAILREMASSGASAGEIIRRDRLAQITDQGQLSKLIEDIISNNPEAVSDFRKGKARAMMFLVGKVMKETKGRANPKIVDKLLKEKLTEVDDA
jgi:aspartyl-tRNA(Asn)/glutamyl-tRNA(Gln) amidotransferase subunit B